MKSHLLVTIIILISTSILAQNNKVPLGQYDKVYLGMTASEVEKAYNCEVVESPPWNGFLSDAKKLNIKNSRVKINLEEIGKPYLHKGLVFNQMHLRFVNDILVYIEFIIDQKYFKNEEKAKEAVSFFKTRYNGQYKGVKEYPPSPNSKNDFSYTFILSTEKIDNRKLRTGINAFYKEFVSNVGNILRFEYAVKAPRTIDKPYYRNGIKLEMKDNETISYWLLFGKIVKKCAEIGLKSTFTFRNNNLGTSLIAFKERYSNNLVAHDPNKNMLLGGYTEKFAPYVEVYKISDEKLSLLNNNLDGVYYIFFEDKLQGIKIVFDKALNQEEYNTLRKNLKTVFGKPSIDDAPEQMGENANTIYISDSYIKNNLGQDFYTELKEDYGDFLNDCVPVVSLNYTKGINPTQILIQIPELFIKLDEKAKADKKESLQSDF